MRPLSPRSIGASIRHRSRPPYSVRSRPLARAHMRYRGRHQARWHARRV